MKVNYKDAENENTNANSISPRLYTGFPPFHFHQENLITNALIINVPLNARPVRRLDMNTFSILYGWKYERVYASYSYITWMYGRKEIFIKNLNWNESNYVILRWRFLLIFLFHETWTTHSPCAAFQELRLANDMENVNINIKYYNSVVFSASHHVWPTLPSR